jgi:hypothetical protein
MRRWFLAAIAALVAFAPVQAAAQGQLMPIADLAAALSEAPPGTILVFGDSLRTESLGVITSKKDGTTRYRRYMRVRLDSSYKYVHTNVYVSMEETYLKQLKRIIKPDDPEWPSKMQEFYRELE